MERASFRIDQVLPSFGRYDAIGTDTLLIRQLLRTRGFASDIFAYEFTSNDEARPFKELLSAPRDPRDIIIHHFSIGSNLSFAVDQLEGFKITRFHNITPHEFFKLPEMIYTRAQCLKGQAQLPLIKENTNVAWAASEFNARDLASCGFENVRVLPVLRDYPHLASLTPIPELAEALLKTSSKTILFVGRMLPHKAQHDLMFLASMLKKHFGSSPRLLLVGGCEPSYKRKVLTPLAKELQLTWAEPSKSLNVDGDILHFPSVSDRELATLYHCSDAFVCMSEHEGFCVPLVEAMHFGLPIIAHRSSAVPETCREGAVIIDKTKNFGEFVSAVAQVLSHSEAAERWSKAATRRSEDFAWPRLCQLFDAALSEVTQSQPAQPLTCRAASRYEAQTSSH